MTPHKDITLEDLGLTTEDMTVLVNGSQRFMPARDEDGELEDITPDVDAEPKRRTS
jgi:hypothetical protein